MDERKHIKSNDWKAAVGLGKYGRSHILARSYCPSTPKSANKGVFFWKNSAEFPQIVGAFDETYEMVQKICKLLQMEMTLG